MVRVLVFGAHPDDAEIFAGGLLVRHCNLGNTVKIVSVTDGRSGHHAIEPEQLIKVRRAEARAAGERIGAEYVTWDFPDGSLTPSIEVREAIIREIRAFKPDLLLTHRPYDYHPDHRAVGTAVQDASYLVTVPHICAETAALRKDPVVAYMPDLFTRPCKLRADVVMEITAEFDTVVQMTACHRSQLFEWLPYHDGIAVPESNEDRLVWLADWLAGWHRKRAQFFSTELVARGLHLDKDLKLEVFEVSEYAGQADLDRLRQLFPGMQ